MTYSVLTPEMNLVNFTGNPTIEQVLTYMYKSWKKHTDSNSFEAWAKELNEDGNYEGHFTTLDAVDNLCNEYHLFINRQDIGHGKLFDLIVSKYNIQ